MSASQTLRGFTSPATSERDCWLVCGVAALAALLFKQLGTECHRSGCMPHGSSSRHLSTPHVAGPVGTLYINCATQPPPAAHSLTQGVCVHAVVVRRRYERAHMSDGRRINRWCLVDQHGSAHLAVIGIERDTKDGHYTYNAVSDTQSSAGWACRPSLVPSALGG